MDASMLFSPSAGNRVILPFNDRVLSQRQDSRDEARTAVHTPTTSDGTSKPSSWDASPHLDTKVRRLSKQQQQQQQRSRDARVKSLQPINHKANNAPNAYQPEHETLVSRRRRGHNDPMDKRRQQQLQALEGETKIYGKAKLKLKRTPGHRGPSGPLDPLVKQIEREKRSHERQVTTLARALEVKIDRMGLDIPVAFLLEKQHVVFAERVMLTAMCKVLTRHLTRIIQLSFARWKHRTLTHRVLTDHARHVLLLKQASLAHACAIVQCKQQLRMRVFLRQWLNVTVAIRLREHNRCAQSIQRYWRKYRLLMRFRGLAQAYRDHVHHVNAITIQSAMRRFLARRLFRRLVVEHTRQLAALCIQRCYANYQIREIAFRQRQREGALTIQRRWRGHIGRRQVALRRQWIRCAAEIVYTVVYRHTALEMVEFVWCQTTKIQRCFRAYAIRCRMNTAMRRNRSRRLFSPACQIQRAWHRYYENQVVLTVFEIVANIVKTNRNAAVRIQKKFRTFIRRKRRRSALVLTALQRCFTARKALMRRQLAWLESWNDRFFTRWCRSDLFFRRSPRWKPLMTTIKRGLNEIKSDQRRGLKRLNTSQGCKLLVFIKRFHHDFELVNARIIQIHWRWHRFRVVMHRNVHAVHQLHSLLPMLFSCYKQRQRRRRVLGRWKRQRFAEMNVAFQRWRAFRLLELEARALKVSNESLRRVKWFRHQKLRKRMLTGWKAFIAYRRDRMNKRNRAEALVQTQIKRRVWRFWVHEKLPELIARHRLSELKAVLHCWQQWTRYCVHQRKTKKAIAWRQKRIKELSIARWQTDLQEMKTALVQAQQHNDRSLLRRTFTAFHRRVAFLKQVDQSCRKARCARGIHQWVFHMCITKQHSTWTHQSHTFHDHCSQANFWKQWTRYVRHRREHRSQLEAMDTFRTKTQLRRSLGQWGERVPILRDLHFTTSLANGFYNVKLKQFVFERGLFQFWADTVGARRIQMAARIQRAFRSKRARKKLFVLRTKLTYQLDAHMAKGLDVVNFTAETLFQALCSKNGDKSRPADLWVFALVSYPWHPVCDELREIFNTVATNWRYLREKRMAFGTISATEIVPSSFIQHTEAELEGDGDERANASYSLLSWLGIEPNALPCIVGFWQGRSSNMMTTGAFAASPVMTSNRRHRHIQRRFERVCGESASPSLVFQLTTTTSSPSSPPPHPSSVLSVMTWIDGLQSASQEATAIDLQAYMRAYLARRLAQQYCEANRHDRARRLQLWFRNLKLKWLMRNRNRAALKLQRWYHATLKRRLAFHNFQSAMARCRHAASVIQRFLRRYFAHKRFKLLCQRLVMTPERFPNAPLCEECFGADQQQQEQQETGTETTNRFVLATLKCRDCTQALCANCFATLHHSGKRMLHLADRIEIRAMNDPSASMCDVCEVAACKKRCGTCKPTSSNESQPRDRGFCVSCFERAHCNPICGGRSCHDHRVKVPWWDSERFKTHEWSRAALGSLGFLSTAQDIVTKYRWTTLAMYHHQHQTLLQAERSQKEREDELFAIRVQHEAILRDAFDRYDSDHSGSIDRVEFKRMFREELCQPLNDDQIDDAMRAMDKSGDGKIQFDELLLWFAEGVRDNKVASQASDLLKDALKAKRTMRRYREKLNALVPPMGASLKDKLSLLGSASDSTPLPPVISKVPGFPSVVCLDPSDYTSKRKVFFRFLKEICALGWVEDDEAIIPIENARDVFNSVFLPRWNAGELTFDFYFDDESFEFEGSEWRRCWDAERRKYVYQTRRKKKPIVAEVENGNGKRRKSSVRKSSRRKSTRKASQVRLQSEREATKEETKEDAYEAVVEVIDPRRKQLLFENAKRAFASADQDASGFIDTKEFHHLLTAELCEPISKAKAREIMSQIDMDKSGKIDFDEFFLWYATDKCQDYPTTPQMERVRAILKTRRRARTTALAAVGAGVNGGLKVKQALEEKLRENQLARDCKGASAELVILLYEGFPKLLASKALSLHQQQVDSARVWLTNKQQEEQREKDFERQERTDRKLLKERVKQEAAAKRKKRVAGVKRTMKLLFFGVNKKETHAAKVQDALLNLDREIMVASQHLSPDLIGNTSKSTRGSIT